jgi:hypothetical protein
MEEYLAPGWYENVYEAAAGSTTYTLTCDAAGSTLWLPLAKKDFAFDFAGLSPEIKIPFESTTYGLTGAAAVFFIGLPAMTAELNLDISGSDPGLCGTFTLTLPVDLGPFTLDGSTLNFTNTEYLDCSYYLPDYEDWLELAYYWPHYPKLSTEIEIEV